MKLKMDSINMYKVMIHGVQTTETASRFYLVLMLSLSIAT